MNRLVQSQVEHNAATSEAWGAFAGHRQRVSDLIAGAAGGERRLCILGAGNCNDIDLNRLLAVYREIHLVDLDATSLEGGVARQGLAGNPALHHYGGIDLTGALGTMAGWSDASGPAPQEIETLSAAPVAHVMGVLPGPFDVVVSTCVLSQLIDAVVSSLGDGHPHFLECVQAVRLGHLRFVATLTQSGGMAVLISDLVSSETLPKLADVREGELAPLLVEAIRNQNFFHGVNPETVAASFNDAALRSEISSIEWLSPWLWDMGPRLYAVWAAKARRR